MRRAISALRRPEASNAMYPEYAVSEAGESMTLRPTEPNPQQQLPFNVMTTDAPLCSECGSIMTRNGSCYKCGNCGGTSGCS